MADTYFIRARKQVADVWPQHLVTMPDMAALDKVWVAPAATISDEAAATLRWSSAIVFEELLGLDLTLIDGLSVSLGEADLALEFPIEVLADYSDLTAPTLQVTIGPLPLLVTLDSALLRPAAVDTTQTPAVYTPLEDPLSLQLGQITLIVDLAGEIGLQGQLGLSLPPVFIGETGIVVEAQAITPILDSTTSRPAELDAAWRGLVLDDVRLVITGDLAEAAPSDIFFDQASIGSGGFSGTVEVNWPVADPSQPFDADARTLAGFAFRLEQLGITLVQNALVGTSLEGFLQVPFFDEALRVTLAMTQTGEVTVGLDLSGGPLTLIKPGVVRIEIDSLVLERDGPEVALVLSGAVTPEIGSGALDWPTVGVDGLRITTTGQVSIEGTWLELPDQHTFDFHSFQVEISRIGFGNQESGGSDYRWIGFSGGIQLVEGLPLRGGVDGLKVLWNDSNAKLEVSAIELGFEVPEVLTFEGFARFEEDPEPLFAGGMDLTIHPLNGLGLDAQFMTGKDLAQDFRYFYLSVDVSLPLGIPLGPPVVGLYGFAGLYAQNMTLDYADLIDYEDPADRPSMTDVAVWQKRKGSMALGAGVTIATVPDNRFTVKVKALLAVLVPGPVVLIEGHAGLLSTKDATTLQVLAVFDAVSGTVLLNISTSYAYPKDTGDLIEIGASAEALFPFDSGAWHVYLGEDTPESKRIRADILTGLFEAQTYLMVDPHRLRFGVWVGYELHEKFGPLRVDLEAWLDGSLTLSRMPFQAEGRVTLFGGVELGAGPVSVGLSVEASVAVEVPKPFSIWAELTVELKTPLGNPKATVTLEWEKEGTPGYPLPLGASHGVNHRKTAESWSLAKSSAYALDADGLLIGPGAPPPIGAVPMVPPDVELVLSFDKPVKDEAGFPGAALAPDPEAVGSYDFTYTLKSVRLEYRESWSETSDDGAWFDYADFASSLDPDSDGYDVTGFWQADPTAQGSSNAQLVLNATTPFSVARLLDESHMLFAFLDANQPGYPCGESSEMPQHCVDFEDMTADGKREYHPMLIRDRVVFVGEYPMVVVERPAAILGTKHALASSGSKVVASCLQIADEPVSGQIKLRVLNNVTVSAAVFTNAYIQFEKAPSGFVGDDTVMTLRNPTTGVNQRPCQFLWTVASFPDLPDWVRITAFIPKMPVGPEHPDRGFLVFEAFNLDNQSIYSAGYVGTGGEIVTFLLQADGETINRIDSLLEEIVVIEVCHARELGSDIQRLLVFTPLPMAEAELMFTVGSKGSVYLYDEEDNELEQIEFSVDRSDIGSPVVARRDDMTGFRSLAIEGVFDLIRVCGTSEEDYATWSDNVDLSTSIGETLEEIWGVHSDKVLFPGLFYRLKVTTSSKRRKNNGDWAEEEFEEHVYFKTGNPPGADDLGLPTRSASDASYHGRQALSDLATYVETTVPMSAAADVAQTAAYRSYDVGVIFNDSYVELMYRMAELPLNLRLLDSNGEPLRDLQGAELSLLNVWGNNADLVLTREETQYQTLYDENCLGFSTSQTESTEQVLAASRELLMAPQMRYTAELRAGAQFTAYRFSFLSSRYASFRHHVHSFVDAVWDHFRLRDEPGYTIEQAAFDHALGLAEDDDVAFERLFELFDLAPRTYPERVEITVLNDQAGDYGFLMESPEALDWSRLEVTLSTASPPQPVPEWPVGPVKLIDAQVVRFGSATSPDYNRQWVELLVQDDLDLSDYVLDATRATEPENFTPFYTFPSGSSFRAGTVIRVHNGTDPGDDPDGREDVYLYANNGESRLGRRNMILRLAAPDGNVLHSRTFHRGLIWNAEDARIIPSGDGARAFIIPLDAGGSPRPPDIRAHRLEL
ncbi:MAG: hypothetical protein AAF637_03000, partial [Pseudomonadota bacterium]